MSAELNETHDPNRRSWVESANASGSEFPIQNLPFCVFTPPDPKGGGPRIGIGIGDRILELSRVADLIKKLKLLPKLAAPTDTETAIEAPTRLVLSPNSYGAWVHAIAPVESAQTHRVELWHTRLAVRTDSGVTEADDFRRTVRAIWSPDANLDAPFSVPPHAVPPTPFLAALDQHDRHNLVHLSANHQLYIPNTKPRKRQCRTQCRTIRRAGLSRATSPRSWD